MTLKERSVKIKTNNIPRGGMMRELIFLGGSEMKKAVIDPGKCDRSPGCPAKRACPVRAIEREAEGEPYYINTNICIGCGLCKVSCRGNAVSLS